MGPAPGACVLVMRELQGEPAVGAGPADSRARWEAARDETPAARGLTLAR